MSLHEIVVAIVFRISGLIRRTQGIQPDLGGLSYAQKEFEKAINFDKKFPSLSLADKIVLEIGSGFGGYIRHALIRQQANFVHAYEPDPFRISISQKYLNGKNLRRYQIHEGDARNMIEIPTSSIDIVVCDAVVEHIQQTALLLSEVYRVLKLDGQAYIAFSPAWYAYNGGHLWNYIPIPWIHVLVPDSVILDVLRRQKKAGEIVEYKTNEMIQCYQELARISVKQFRKYVEQSSFSSYEIWHGHERKWKERIGKSSSLLLEMFPGNVRCVLKK